MDPKQNQPTASGYPISGNTVAEDTRRDLAKSVAEYFVEKRKLMEKLDTFPSGTVWDSSIPPNCCKCDFCAATTRALRRRAFPPKSRL